MKALSKNLPILRYCVSLDNRDDSLNRLFECCDKVGTEEILLFTDQYLRMPSFKTPDEQKEHFDHLSFCVEKIKKQNIRVAINVMNTLGHVYVTPEEINHFNFLRQTDRHGNPTRHPVFDPCCNKLQEYASNYYNKIAQLEPLWILIDDDFTIAINTCFNSKRLEKFAESYGCDNNLDTIGSLLFSSDDEIREKSRATMFSLTTQDMTEMANIIRNSVHKHNPEIPVGQMIPRKIFFDITKSSQALAGKHTPIIRPQIPIYSEGLAVSEYSRAFWDITYWNAKLPNTMIVPEAENYPYCPELKSPNAAFAHSASCFAKGNMLLGLSLNSFPTGVTKESNDTLIDKFAEHKGQIRKLAKITKNAKPSGFGLWQSGQGRWQNIIEETDVNWCLLAGLPLYSCENPNDAVLFFGQDIKELPIEEVESIVKRGALFDLEAAEYLEKLGLLEKTGLKLGTQIGYDEILHSQTIDDDSYIGNWPLAYFIYHHIKDGDMPRKIDCKNYKTYSSFVGKDFQKTEPLLMTWLSPDNKRFGLFNIKFRTWPAVTWINPWMGKITKKALKFISGEPLKIHALNGFNINITTITLQNSDTLATICNFSTSSQENIEININKELFNEVDMISQDGTLLKQPVLFDDSCSMKLRMKKLEPLDCSFLLLRKSK